MQRSTARVDGAYKIRGEEGGRGFCHSELKFPRTLFLDNYIGVLVKYLNGSTDIGPGTS